MKLYSKIVQERKEKINMEHREELNMELITEAEGVPELPEGLVSSGYMSGTSPPNSIYEQMDQEFQTPLIPYNATSLRSDLDFSGAAVYEVTKHFQCADIEVVKFSNYL